MKSNPSCGSFFVIQNPETVHANGAHFTTVEGNQIRYSRCQFHYYGVLPESRE